MMMLTETSTPELLIALPFVVAVICLFVCARIRVLSQALGCSIISAAAYIVGLAFYEGVSGLFLIGFVDVLILHVPI